jgi:diguanylate cyclase (GGDEF)-like protein
MGGDEFVVIVAGAAREATAAKSRQFQQVTRDVGLVLHQQDILSVSIGEAYFPEDGADAEQLLAVADKRMYEAKQRCRPNPIAQLA